MEHIVVRDIQTQRGVEMCRLLKILFLILPLTVYSAVSNENSVEGTIILTPIEIEEPSEEDKDSDKSQDELEEGCE
jgi:hypothetical protein|tara:strand:+ start:417 stop:644 length:228 start_codon:yes stop_codon:yes gene_type:complete